MKNANFTSGDTLVDEVKIDLHVLCALMLHKIGGHVDHADVITVDEGGALEGAVELLKKLMEPGSLGHIVGHRAVLGLSAGVGDDWLPL
jgi:nucleoside-triphosphatase THEP1